MKTFMDIFVTLILTVIVCVMWEQLFEAPRWAALMYSLILGENFYKSLDKK